MKPTRLLAILVAALALAACGARGAGNGSSAVATSAKSAATAAHAHRHRSRYASVRLTVTAGNGKSPLNKPRRLTLPRGWQAEVWARVFDARLETWTPEGDLLVSAPFSDAIFKLVPRAQPSDPPLVEDLVKNLTLPQGLAFDTLAGHEVLYVAESDQLDRYQWNNGELGARTVVVPNLPDTHPSGDDNHRFKNVVVGSDHTVYIDIASASNASPQNPSDRPPRASVLAVNPDGSHLRVFATGIRNGDGLSFAPDGTLWTAVNERDDIHYPFHRSYGGVSRAFNQIIPAYVNNHPPDELARLTAGRNLGWPFCNPDPDVKPGVPGTRFDYSNMRFVPDAETNAGSRRLRCSKLKRIERGIPAHSAPLGFHFLEGSPLPARLTRGAVIGAHGSWDRKPPRSPAVLWLPWNRAKRTLGSPITIVSGFQQGGRWGRPVDAVPGPDGALYVTDDTANAIYRIVPTKGF